MVEKTKEPGVATCSKCDALIGWTLTRAGLRMPVDWSSLSQEDREQFALIAAWFQKSPRVGLVPRMLMYRHGEHVSHFATCKHAAEFRKSKKPKERLPSM